MEPWLIRDNGNPIAIGKTRSAIVLNTLHIACRFSDPYQGYPSQGVTPQVLRKNNFLKAAILGHARYVQESEGSIIERQS
jgi:hypothetical protein